MPCEHHRKQWDAEGVNYQCLDCGTVGQSDYYECRQAYREEVSLAQLQEENKKLRKALEEIASMNVRRSWEFFFEILEKAKEALK